MPSPVSIVDWTLAKVLRAQGFGWSEISQKVGSTPESIRVRASREGWNNLQKQASTVLEEYGIELASKTIKEQAPKLAEAWLSEMQGDTVDRLKDIRKLPKPKNLDDAKKREEMMLTHVKAGRASFGLDDQKGSVVQVAIMANLAHAMDSSTGVAVRSDTVAQSVEGDIQDAQVVDTEGD